MATTPKVEVRCPCGNFLFWTRGAVGEVGRKCRICKREVTWSPGRIVAEDASKT